MQNMQNWRKETHKNIHTQTKYSKREFSFMTPPCLFRFSGESVQRGIIKLYTDNTRERARTDHQFGTIYD